MCNVDYPENPKSIGAVVILEPRMSEINLDAVTTRGGFIYIQYTCTCTYMYIKYICT